MAETTKKAHVVLVHGFSHGAWAWYKVKPRLEAAGHLVTALDMTGCGISPTSMKDVSKFEHYAKPLIEFMKSVDEKVMVVGHSVGGLCLALAMEKFPEKISVAVFAAAYLPDTKNAPSHVIDKLMERLSQADWLDSHFEKHGEETIVLFSERFVKKQLYALSPPEDVELAKYLLRPGSHFEADLRKSKKFSDEAYGSVKKVYVICKDDVIFPEEYPRWMIENCPVDEVVEIKGADHVPMFSKPQEFSDSLLQIAHKYA